MKILIENYDSDESTENCLPDYEKNRLQNIKEKEIQIKDVKKVAKETKKAEGLERKRRKKSNSENGEKPFQCDLCKKTFSTHQELENHSHICPKLKLRARATSHNIDLTPPYLSVEA